MVVGAGAAFSDQSKIKNTEAVDACTALNIIGGYPDGSFKPEGNITRAEVTKMICVALNGGKNPAVSTNTTPTFSDVRNNANAAWAEGYIESCAAQGIVSGVGGGKFAPNGNVTGVQLAKMLLVSLGYKSENEGFTGNAWATNVNVRAAQKGLYEGLEKMDTNAAITRDNAAQMVWNALNAYEVEYKTTLTTDANGQLTSQITVQDKVVGSTNDKITLLEDKYEADTAVGTFDGNSKVVSENCKDGNIRISNVTINGEKITDPVQFKYDLDLKYLGEEVKVLYKDNKDGVDGKLDDKDTIYGVYVTGATTVYNITKDDLQDPSTSDLKAGKIKFNDKTYEVAGDLKATDVIVNTNYGADTDTASDANAVTANATTTNKANFATYIINNLKAQSGDTIKFVCNNDGKITKAYVVTSKLAKVNSVNSTKVSLSGVGSIEFADNNIYKDIKKDDVVVVTTYYKSSATADDAYSIVTKAETVTGKLTGYKADKTNTAIVEKVTVDGKTYKVADKNLTASLTDDYKTTLADNNINDTVTLYLVNGYVDAIDAPDSASNYAVVESVSTTATGNADSIDPFKMKVMLADGTEKTVTIDKDSDYLTSASGSLGKNAIPENSIVKYSSINSSNVMDLSSVSKKYATDFSSASVTSPATTVTVYDKDTKTFAGTMTESDAVLFVNSKNGADYYAYNLRSLNDINVADGTKYVAITNSDGKVEAAYVELGSKPSGAIADTVYGIVTDKAGIEKINDDYQMVYTVANNEGEYTVYMPTSATLEEGDIVYFDQSADKTYSKTDVKKISTGLYAKELDKDKVLSYYTNVAKTADGYVGYGLQNVALDSDAKIVYVDQDNDKAGTDIGVTEFDKINGYANIAIVKGSDNKIDAIIVESSGECNVVNKMNTKTTLTDAQIKALADGVYNPADTTFAPDVAGDARDNVIIKFTTKTANTATVLTIKDSADVIVYKETILGGSNGLAVGSHYFYLNKFDPSVSSGRLTNAMVPGQTYSYTITEGADTIASGYFTA